MELIAHGPPEGRPLLVLHGGPGETHHVLRPHLDALAADRADNRDAREGRGRRVVYYDQRREPVDHHAHVADVDRARRLLGPTSVDLLGFSWGALLAMLYALEHPEGVANMILVSPPPVHGAADAEVRARVELAMARPEVLALGNDPIARRIGAFLFDPSRVRVLHLVASDEAIGEAAYRGLAGFDLRSCLPSLRAIPTLVIHGEDDPIPTATARETAELLGGELVLLERCGHAPFVEAAESFVFAVNEFLSRSSR